MALGRYNSAAFLNNSGVPVIAALAMVEVRNQSDDALSSIFADVDGLTPKGNPFIADADGKFEFFAAARTIGYKVRVSSGVKTHQLTYQPIGTAQYRDFSLILDAFNALVAATDKLPYFTGAAAMSATDFTAFARTLLGVSFGGLDADQVLGEEFVFGDREAHELGPFLPRMGSEWYDPQA